MPLRLQVISAHRESMGGSYLQEFAACGGTIGRSLECDWPLPDSKRYISSKHAMIDYQSGAYYLVDLSRNGVFVNGSDTPVGKGKPQRLFDGDTIRLGEFEIQAGIINDPNEGDDDGMRDSVVRAQLVPEDESMELAMLSADQINDQAPMDAMLRPSDSSGELSGLRELPVDASDMLRSAAQEQLTGDIAADFLRAAGANPEDFRGIEPKELLLDAARLLAEYTEATHALLKSKDKITSRLKLKSGSKNTATNPLRSAEGIDKALRMLLGNGNDVATTGTKAIESSFVELLQHQKAVVAAMQSALTYYMGHFEPAALEQHFTEAKKRQGGSEAAFREMYAEAYEGLAEPNGRKTPKRFDAEFIRAYELETTD